MGRDNFILGATRETFLYRFASCSACMLCFGKEKQSMELIYDEQD